MRDLSERSEDSHEKAPNAMREVESRLDQALRDAFSAVMTADAALFQPELEKLVVRYKADAALPAEADVKDLVLMLNSQFPGDIGVFCAFMLNHMTLKPGEAIFLAAGEPHAYVSGGVFSSFGIPSEY